MSPLFGGLPATGAIARTTTNIRTGGKTPVAGMIHAATLFAVLLVGAPLAKLIPMPLLAGILLIVAYTMDEWNQVPELLKLTAAEIVILRLRNMTALDASGFLMFEELASRLRETGRTLVVCGARDQPAGLMRHAEFERQVGRDNICDNVLAALERARSFHEQLMLT